MKLLNITVLVKHGSHFLHVLTSPITLIHCKDAMKIDASKLPQVVENFAPGATLTHFNIAAILPQESFEVTKNVVFGFTNE